MDILTHNIIQRIKGRRSDPPEAYISADEARERLGVSAESLEVFVRGGMIRRYTIGDQVYCRKADIDDLL